VPKIQYQPIKFKAAALATIAKVNAVIVEYRGQGLDLTLRQLFYVFVSRGWIPNKDREYKRLGDVVSNARMAGLVDWEAIVDRTRFVRENAHWDTPEDIVKACAKQFRVDKWADQPEYVIVLIEKDALVGVIEQVCRENDVPYLACRGYASASEIWRLGRERLRPVLMADRQVTVLYLGDHDPSGIDMTRDIQDRLRTFSDCSGPLRVQVERLALNMDQIDLYKPPPNPAKMSDSRAAGYVDEYGDESWELDALDPVVIRDLIANAIDQRRDDDVWKEAVAREKAAKADLVEVARYWDSAVAHVREKT
jgi:hypothetical protein